MQAQHLATWLLFLDRAAHRYPDNPYHSATHAADVLQTLHVIIHGAQLHVHYLDALGLFASYFAAVRYPLQYRMWLLATFCIAATGTQRERSCC